MANIIQPLPDPKEKWFQTNLSWKENPAAKNLLDVLSQIIAEEYCQKAKQNPDIFSKTDPK